MRLRIRIGMMVTWNDFQVEVYVISHWILILIPTIVQHSNPFFTLTVILKQSITLCCRVLISIIIL